MDDAERARRAYSYARGLDTEGLAELVRRLGELLAERRGGPDPDEWLTLPEAAAVAGLSTGTLHTQRRRGRPALARRGGAWWVQRRELARYLAERDTHRGSYARGMAPDASSTKGA